MQGTTFGPYTIEELLGRGGMGEVYRAFDTETDREVALKVLPPALAVDAEYTERFRRECRAAAKLREPHVVPIHRFGEIDGRLYLDMRLVEGSDLGAWLHAHGPLAPAAAVAVISQVASALDAAHAEGMVHRDVKPSNILLTGVADDRPVDPGEVFAYLFDFGIASSSGASEPGAEQLTRTGTVPGSVAYLAPERFHGIPADRRVDVYALACVLHQALTGQAPFAGDLPTLMHAHLSLPPPPIDRADVPAALADVVARGMAKDPDHRHPTAGALASAARAAVGASNGSAPTAPPPASGDTRTSVFGAPETQVGTPWTPTPAPGPYPPPNGHPAWGQQSDPQQPGAGGWGHQGGPGGWAQQSDPGAWGRPSGPGQGQQSNPGAWGQQPTWGAQQAPTPPKRSRAGMIAAIAGALVVVAGLVVAAVLLVNSRKDTGTTQGAGSSSAAQTAGPRSTAPQIAPGTALPSAGPAAPGSPAAALVADLPPGFTAATCVPDDSVSRSIGAVAYVLCEGGPADGPDGATFSRYAQQAELDEAFAGAARAANVPVVENGQHSSCKTGATLATGYSVNDQDAGRVGCYKDAASGAAFLFWIDDTAKAFGYLRRSDGDMTTLYDWWSASDFRTP
ncbi:serine/threonine-protein kinase [Pseudonocardia ailaonensis]|uniref:non-specific serine/threonine protein kinase n=1 Tax=Pseudonocardia ailaonensis TaxID=367279 RepID=A0ABN2MJU3_9PSEU